MQSFKALNLLFFISIFSLSATPSLSMIQKRTQRPGSCPPNFSTKKIEIPRISSKSDIADTEYKKAKIELRRLKKIADKKYIKLKINSLIINAANSSALGGSAMMRYRKLRRIITDLGFSYEENLTDEQILEKNYDSVYQATGPKNGIFIPSDCPSDLSLFIQNKKIIADFTCTDEQEEPVIVNDITPSGRLIKTFCSSPKRTTKVCKDFLEKRKSKRH